MQACVWNTVLNSLENLWDTNTPCVPSHTPAAAQTVLQQQPLHGPPVESPPHSTQSGVKAAGHASPAREVRAAVTGHYASRAVQQHIQLSVLFAVHMVLSTSVLLGPVGSSMPEHAVRSTKLSHF